MGEQGHRKDRRFGGRRRGGGKPKGPGHEGQASRAPRPQHHDSSTPSAMDTTPDTTPAPPPLTMAVPDDTPRFAELKNVHPTIIQTITEELKFDHMLPVQAATLEELLPPNRADCLVQAKTGTGKTIAFLLPALQNMITMNRLPANRGCSLLVITPTRELAMQIQREALRLLARMPEYRVCLAIGGTDKDKEAARIRKGSDILIATPGRLLDHLNDEVMLSLFGHLDTLVLDEADRLLDMGFMPDIKKIVRHLPDKTATNRQGMLFSATIPPHVQEVSSIVLAQGYKFISTIPPGEVNTHERVPQILIKSPSFSQTAAVMVSAVREESVTVRSSEGNPPFKAIIFAPTAALADFYGYILSNLPDFSNVSVLHSRMSQNKRTKVTDDYRLAQSAVLVTTDVIARGMDFPGVTSVFQVGIPADKESYIHRLGRTARAGAEGRGILIVSEAEDFFPRWTLKEIKLQPHSANLTAADEVAALATKMDEETTAKIYQAWLGYYKNYIKPLKWTTEELVEQGNIFASEGLQAPETPVIYKTTVGKMGLRGVKGLRVVPAPPKTGQHRQKNGDGEAQGRGQGGGGRRRGGRGGRGGE